MKRKYLGLIMTFIIASTFCSCKVFSPKSQNNKSTSSSLNGNWQLNYISDARIAFNGLYPNAKPQITFDTANNEIKGNTSCNGFRSTITINGNKLTIAEPGPMTMMYCEGGGERNFLDMLKKVTSYNVNETTLTLKQGDIAVMRFTKK